MLQRIRDGLQGQRWLAWLVLAAIAVTFVFWGGSGMLDPTAMGTRNAAEVNGEEIPVDAALSAWSDEQARWSRQFGTEIPEDRKAKIQDDVLERLVVNKLVEQRLVENDYRVSDTAVRDQLLRTQLQRGIHGSNFLTAPELRRLLALENEEREVQYVVLSPEKFVGEAAPDDAAINAYYEKNADRFMTTESVSLEYAELRLEQVASGITPTEEDLLKAYAERREQFVVEERRRARHILIKPENDEAAAQKKAEEILAEARAGKDFAELARQHSQDTSAQQGGDLGFAERSNFVGPFSDALFSMKVGDVTGPVKSQFGYHIIKLEEIEAGKEKSFEEVRAEVDAQYRQDRAAELFSTRQDEIAERLERGENDLDQLAQALGLERGSVPEFLRGGGAAPLGSSPELQDVVFSDETLNQGKIGGPVGLGEDRLVLVKVTAHHKPELKPLATVREEIVALLREERGIAAAKAAAEEALPKVAGGAQLSEVAKAWSLNPDPPRFVGRGDPSIPAALRTAIFEAPRPSGATVARTTALDDGSTALFVLTRSRQPDNAANPQLTRQMNDMLLQRTSTGDIVAYIEEARRKAKVVKNPEVFP